MDSPVIVFANIQQSVGKSTLCLALANFLGQIRGKSVSVFDCSAKRTLLNKRTDDREAFKDACFPYKVHGLRIDNPSALTTLLNNCKKVKGIYLFDTDSNISAPGIDELFANSDFIIIPVSFNGQTMANTIRFLIHLNALKKQIDEVSEHKMNAQIIMLPNRQVAKPSSKVEMELRQDFRDKCSAYCTFAPNVSLYSKNLELNTYDFLDDQRGIFNDYLNFINDTIAKTK